MSINKTDPTSLSPNEERLLNVLIDKGVRETKPKKLGDEATYEGLEDLTKELGSREIKKTLKILSAKGFMSEKNYDSAIFCPNCGSIQVHSKYICPQCQSMNVQKVQLLEHHLCGYIGNRGEFEQNGDLVCPKCKTIIGDFYKAISRDQNDKSKIIRVIGSSFGCDKCSGKFEKPLISHNCVRCGATFTYREANYERLPYYELTEKVDGLAPNRFVMDALRGVEKQFAEKGYTVVLSAKIMGKSGVEQTFDLAARKEKALVLLDISAWGNQNDLISLLGKKMDVDTKSIILLDLTGNPTLASLGKPYNIIVLNGKDEGYLGTLDNLLSGEGKEKDENRGTLFGRRSK